MKRILTLVLSFTMILTCFSFSASANNEKQLFFELSSNGESTIVVDAGEEFIVDFYVQNTIDDNVFGITALENQIEYKHELFEFVSADLEAGPAYWAKDGDCSWDRTIKWLEIMSKHFPEAAAYNNRQLVTRVTFKVKDGIEEGSSGVLSSKACYAAYGSAQHTISTKDMKVFVGSIPAITHTLTYINEGNVINESKDLVHGENVKIYGAPPDVENKKFAGWVDQNQVVWEAGADYTVEGDMTFTAKWLNKHTLSFETNGGTTISPLVRWEEQEINLDEYTTARTGYDFEGWYSDLALTQKITSVTLDSDKTIYAKWTAKSGGNGGSSGTSSGGGGGNVSSDKEYTITFENTDGTFFKEHSSKANTEINLENLNIVKDGYTIEGFYTDKEMKNRVTTIKLSKDMTLYINWVKSEGTPSVKPGNQQSILTTEHYAYIVGREGGRIEPMANITRAEVATIFFRLLTEDVRKANLTKENAFDDVNNGDWFETAVSTLAKLGIIKGRTESTFEPGANITRAEFTTIAARFSDATYNGEDLFTDIKDHWAKAYINQAASLGWVVGDGGIFRPNDKITRAEVMTLVNRVLNRIPESEEDLSDAMTKWEDNSDKTAWYYLAVQEATNSHKYEIKPDGKYEKWTQMSETPNWAEFEK